MKRVLEWGMQRRSFVRVEDGATKGATIGKDVFKEDGTLYDPSVEITEIVESTVDSIPSFFATIWRLILEIPPNIVSLAALTGIGFATRISAASEWANRVITGTAGRITILNGDGVTTPLELALNAGGFLELNAGGNLQLNTETSGDPTIDLDMLSDSGVGVSPLMLFTRDVWGRISGTQDAVWSDLPLPGYIAITGTYAVLPEDSTVNAVSGTFVETLPTAISVSGKIYNLKNSGTGVITLATTSGQTIDDNASGTLTLIQYENLVVQSNGANWIIL